MRSILKNKRIAVVLYAVMIMLVTTTVAIGVYDLGIKSGTIAIEGEVEQVKTKQATVGELLQEKNIELENDDYINISTGTELENDFEIEIRRAVPVVLNFKDKQVEITTGEPTVGDVLKSLSIFYSESDEITPKPQTKVVKDMQITYMEIEEKIKTIEEEIPFEVVASKNEKLEKGKTIVEQEGIKGLRNNKVKETYKNGKLVDTQVLETNLVREPVKQIVQEGSKAQPVTVASRGTSAGVSSGVSSISRTISMNASAYDLSYASCGKHPGDPYYGITASGTKARPGVVAVDTRVIPFGTKMKIDGFGDRIFTAEDRGGAIKGNKIDIFFANRSDALRFGRKQVNVHILN